MRIRSTSSLALVGAVGASLIAGCAGAPESRLEPSPSVGVVGVASPTRASNEPVSGTDGTWDPSWPRPDATVELKPSGCELDGTNAIDPGILTIAFVNQSYREGYIKVVQVPPGRRLGDLRAGIGIAGGGAITTSHRLPISGRARGR